MLTELRRATRALARAPGFTLSTIIILALGIGANTAVFSIVRAVLLRPLPYHEPDRLVYLWEERHGAERRHGILTGNQVIQLKDHVRSVSGFAVLKTWEGNNEGKMDLFRPEGAERLRGSFATSNLFELLGVNASIGRTFVDTDSAGEPVAVISDGLWRRRFAADPSVVGRQIQLMSGRPRAVTTHTVIGVLPPGFRFTYPQETEVWAVLPWSSIRPMGAVFYQMIGRLKPGVRPEQAQAEATAAEDARLSSSGPRSVNLRSLHIAAEPLPEHLESEVRPGVYLLAGVAALVLLIACVNLGLLVMARTVDRARELAVRASLGASTSRLLRQLATEGLALALIGGAGGVLTAFLAQPILRSTLPPLLPRGDEASLDGTVLAFALAVIGIVALVCALTPAWIVLRSDPQATLRRATGTVTSDRSVTRSRRLVVGVQVCVVMVLLVASGLLLRSFWRLQHVELGFNAQGVTMVELRLLNPRYFGPGARIAQVEQALLERVRALPGIERAAISTAVPMQGVDFTISTAGGSRMRAVDPAYFDILKIPLVAGRFLEAGDTPASKPVTVVSESLGRKLFGAVSPLGHQLDGDKMREIVGVVRDVRYTAVTRPAEPAFYVPRAQAPSWLITILLRSAATAPGLEASIRKAVQEIDPEQPIEGIATIDSLVTGNTAEQRFYAISSAGFAGVALTLAVVGLFGVVARTVTERRRELAIRIALGADARRLLRLVFVYGLTPVAVGLVIGQAMAFALSRVMRRFLFEIAPSDPVTYVGATVLVAVVALAACYLPALRALRMQPMAVLKAD